MEICSHFQLQKYELKLIEKIVFAFYLRNLCSVIIYNIFFVFLQNE